MRWRRRYFLIKEELPSLYETVAMNYEGLIKNVALNTLNRSMGQRDLYPFSLPDQVQRKIGFVHDLVAGRRGGPTSSPSGAPWRGAGSR